MEATKEEDTGLLGKILPPRLEDAGLEDCALPPDSIHEAFLKAAGAVKSRAAALFDVSDGEAEEGGCVADPWPAIKEKKTDKVIGADLPMPGASDTVVVGGASDKGPCLTGKGYPEVKEEDEGNDAVIVIGGEEKDGTKECGVDGNGSDGLGVEERKKKRRDDEEEEDDDDDTPVLISGVI